MNEIKLPRALLIGTLYKMFDGIEYLLEIILQQKISESIGLIIGVWVDKYWMFDVWSVGG